MNHVWDDIYILIFPLFSSKVKEKFIQIIPLTLPLPQGARRIIKQKNSAMFLRSLLLLYDDEYYSQNSCGKGEVFSENQFFIFMKKEPANKNWNDCAKNTSQRQYD